MRSSSRTIRRPPGARWKVPSLRRRNGPRRLATPEQPDRLDLSAHRFERVVPGETAWPALLGRKVSIRYFSRDDGQPSEAIGAVMSVSEDPNGREMVTIVNRRGLRRVVRVEDITAGKIWPTR